MDKKDKDVEESEKSIRFHINIKDSGIQRSGERRCERHKDGTIYLKRRKLKKMLATKGDPPDYNFDVE